MTMLISKLPLIVGRMHNASLLQSTETSRPRTLPYFLQGVKKCDFGPYRSAQQRSSSSRRGLKTAQEIFTVFELGVHQ